MKSSKIVTTAFGKHVTCLLNKKLIKFSNVKNKMSLGALREKYFDELTAVDGPVVTSVVGGYKFGSIIYLVFVTMSHQTGIQGKCR